MRLVFILKYVGLFLLLFVVLAGHGQCQGDNNKKGSRKPFVIMGDRNYPPLEFLNENGQPEGFNIDVLEAVAEAAGLEYKLNLSGWDDVRKRLESGEIDALAGMFYSKERDRVVDFSEPFFEESFTVFVRKDSQVRSPEDIRNRQVIVLKGDMALDFLRENQISDKIIPVFDIDNVLNMLSSGVGDCAVLPRFYGLSSLNRLGFSNLKSLGFTLFTKEYCFAVKEGDSNLLGILNEGLREVKSSGLYDQIYDNWFGFYKKERTSYRKIVISIAWIIFAFVAMSLVFFVWTGALRKQVRERTRELGLELSEREKMQEVLKESEEKYRTLFNNFYDVYYLSDKDGYIVNISPSATKVFGYGLDELIGKRVVDFYEFPETRDAFIEEVRKTGTVDDYEARVRKKDGSFVWISTNGKMVLDSEGKFSGVEGVTRDVTARKQAEQERLRHIKFLENMERVNCIIRGGSDSEKTMDLLLDSVLDIFSCDRAWLAYPCDPDAMEMSVKIERTLPEFPGALDTGENLALDKGTMDVVKDLLRTERPMSLYLDTDTGLSSYIEKYSIKSVLVVAVFPRLGKPWIFGIHQCSEKRDWNSDEKNTFYEIGSRISEALSGMLYHHDLRQSEEMFRTIYENIPAMIGGLDSDGRVFLWNRSLEENLGFSFKEARQSSNILRDCFPDPEIYVKALEDISKVDGVFREYSPVTRDGEIRNHLWASFRLPSGLTVVVGHDFTETRLLESRLQQAQKMEAIGTLAGGIAHDFNNILSAIIGYSQLADLRINHGEGAGDCIGKIVKSGERAKELVKQILTFSRQGGAEKRPLDLGREIGEVMKLLRPTIPVSIDIELDVPEKLGMVMADQTQIHQVVLNLCTNAAQALGDNGGVITVSLARCSRMDSSIIDARRERPGAFVQLSVADNGPGIDPEVESRIFDPYFTTKDVGAGTGLGLSTVHGIVSEHGGSIRVVNRPGRGTVFRVFFPCLEADCSDKKVPEDRMVRGTGKILFVDDEPFIGDIGKQILESLGYEVLVETDSMKALERFKKSPGDFNVVITDYTMPGMTGDRLSRKILDIRPDIPILMCSGYSTSMTREKILATGVRGFLMKPLSAEDLSEGIKKVLENSSP